MRSVEPHPPPAPEEEPPSGSGPPDWVRVLLLVAFAGAFVFGTNWLIHDAPLPSSPIPTATPVTAPVPVAQPTRAPTPIPTRAPTLAPKPQPTSTTAPTAVPTIAPILAETLATDWWDWSSEQIEPAQKSEAVAAIDRFWSTLARSWWDLKPEFLVDALTSPQLDTMTAVIQQRRDEGRAQKVNVQRVDLVVRYIDGKQAVVYETYVNHSVAVDVTTKSPLEQPPTELQESSYLLWKVDGTYKVADVVSHESQ